MPENFLEMRCPKCGDEDKLDIQASTWLRVCDDGFDDDVPNCGGHEYQQMNPAICRACNHVGTLSEFQTAGRAP
jgi:hypothetical protein